MPLGKKQIILGIDPGVADTGYGLIQVTGQEISALDYGSIQTSKHCPLEHRLVEIEKQLIRIIQQYQPTKIGIEKLYFCKNVTTAISVGQARGVVMLTAAKNQLPIVEFTPLQVKQAVTGYGQATKSQIQQMVKTILKLKAIPKPDDAADALAIAICSINHSALD